ncbi:hypothetical protein [Novosphingopyxis sp.]|uniref:hypothetical protein n=1 Tax=Novosphingopyxis sp. TaxID=2709690 RepID=UPI003B59E00C
MDLSSPQQFDRAAAQLAAIDYPTLRAMLVARFIARNARSRRSAAPCRHAGTIAERLDFFAGRIDSAVRPSGPFAPLAGFVPNGKKRVYLGASTSGRDLASKTLSTQGATAAAPFGDTP